DIAELHFFALGAADRRYRSECGNGRGCFQERATVHGTTLPNQWSAVRLLLRSVRCQTRAGSRSIKLRLTSSCLHGTAHSASSCAPSSGRQHFYTGLKGREFSEPTSQKHRGVSASPSLTPSLSPPLRWLRGPATFRRQQVRLHSNSGFG